MRVLVVVMSLLALVPALAWSDVILWGRAVDVAGVIRGEPLRAKPWYQLSVFPDAATCRQSYPRVIVMKEGEEVDDPRLVDLLTHLTLRCLPEGVSPNNAEENGYSQNSVVPSLTSHKNKIVN